MYDQNNVFAKILRGEIPSFKVYEDATALSFMDAMPQADGHTLVIPKVEARNFFDISPAALADLINATQHVARSRRRPDRISYSFPHSSLL
jgi:histidine triad (HIT) family protein